MVDFSTLKAIQEKLHEAGFKLTTQRQAVVSVILEKEKDHLSAEEIFLYVRKKDSGIGLATVYRTLEILTDLHIVDRVSFTDDGVALYDLRKAGAKHFHHHLVCENCGSVEEIEEDLLLDVEKLVEKEFQFLVRDHRLTFQGLCKNCH
ncbi:Fur family transcriptional regulator, ferric uptake regulator [Pilibacter termitis]|uniref:Fur family transcriptional regulator, ferric uptake regulator n=1 Tax=Pilibacter termitis TaxID=263852 RepID=A0A1T4QNS2_9ENTE|nr:Fur family transcriptional regulator [Pilibacter termitis]SKA04898.1 Fur family transcriptional regulator, ferric uptake regulator [Pilibacter termitis]